MNSFFPIAALLLILFGGCEKNKTQDLPAPFLELVNEQRNAYPAMQLEDWYKLFHQAAMGNRHLGVEDSVIFNYMLEELNSIGAAQNEQLVEYISSDSSVVRLNMRPFKAASGSPEMLFDAMKRTWKRVEQQPAQLENWGKALAILAGEQSFPFTADRVAEFFEEKQAAGFPAIHHSKAYGEAYAPAYRVLLREYVPLLPAD
ncbi:MAG: hypothetical protein AAF564_25715 [Bacteroidota bacterium]